MFDTTWAVQVEKIIPPILRNRGMIDDGNGDFMQGVADNNYIEYIIVSAPGHWKEFPVVGVQIFGYLLSSNSPQVLRRAIELQLRNDIFTKPSVDVSLFPVIRVNKVTIDLQ